MAATEALLFRLLRQSQEYGFLGPADIAAHVEHARDHGRAASPDDGGRWCDLGSGGGVPGLVIALEYPQVSFVLLDRSVRRAEFLEMAIHELGLTGRVTIAIGDAAELAHHRDHRHSYDGVVSRSFGPPAAVAECCVGLLRLGGRLIVSEPPDAQPCRWPPSRLSKLGLVRADRDHSAPAFAVLERSAATSLDYPRPWKKIRKRPLF